MNNSFLKPYLKVLKFEFCILLRCVIYLYSYAVNMCENCDT
jgi:hypothetical protein